MRLSPGDVKSLQVFRAVVEHNGFLGAQTALNMGQPAVSFHIKALEERVGFRVCQRGRRGFATTEKGALLYERSKILFSALSTLESEIGELRHTITGTLRLGIVDNTISDPDLPLSNVIRDFLRKGHQARLEISVQSPEQLLAEVGNGGLDLAIMPETSRIKQLSFSAFHEEIHSLFCSADHPLARLPAAAVERARVEAHPFVVRPYANLRELQHFSGAEVRATASNVEAQAMFILSGHFLGYLPDHYAEHWLERGELVPLMRDAARIVSPFYIVTHEHQHRSALLRIFIQELVSATLTRLQTKGSGRVTAGMRAARQA